MVHIPPGTFQMGSPVGVGAPNEEPLHAVTVSGFDLDATEVSVADYDRCVGAGVCLRADTSWGCNEGNAGRARHPINCVTRSQASAFCRWAGKRLPSEEEWEYAARGPEGRLYPWGGAMPTGQLCWHRSDGTCPVASFPRGDSSLGLHDMSGNVSEWTSSGWSDNYSQPRAQQTGVGRGGGWDSSDPSFVRTSARFRGVESQQSFSIGFRCAR